MVLLPNFTLTVASGVAIALKQISSPRSLAMSALGVRESLRNATSVGGTGKIGLRTILICFCWS